MTGLEIFGRDDRLFGRLAALGPGRLDDGRIGGEPLPVFVQSGRLASIPAEFPLQQQQLPQQMLAIVRLGCLQVIFDPRLLSGFPLAFEFVADAIDA
jgi:hypothetical protein